MGDIILFLTLLLLTYTTGTILEKNHYKKIKERELRLVKHPIISYGSKNFTPEKPVRKVELVTGEVVISGDYFKFIVAVLKNFFGGRLKTFESILDRGRREAILRMREKAINADIIVNTKVESVMLNDISRNNTIPQCAIIAYGTAITYAKSK